MARTIEVDLHEMCPACDEPLGLGLIRGDAVRIVGNGAQPSDEFPAGCRVEVCPFCRTVRVAPDTDIPLDKKAPAADTHCAGCTGETNDVTVQPGAFCVALEETTAILHAEDCGSGRYCPSCRMVRLIEGRMELRGMEVALQRGEVRRAFGVSLWRGFLIGGLFGAVLVLILWNWEGIGGFATVASAGALIGSAMGAILGALGSLGWSLVRGEGRERLS